MANKNNKPKQTQKPKSTNQPKRTKKAKPAAASEPLSDTWYRQEDVAAMLKISKSTIYRWRESGKFKAAKDKGIILINKTDLDNYLRGLRG